MFKQLCKTLFQKSRMFSTSYKNVQNGFATMTTDVEAERIVWMDLEMTGLDVNQCYIMEAAALITDAQLNIIAEGPDIVIHQPSEILDNMDPWCIKQHGKTGLTEACRTSAITLEEAEKTMLKFFYKHVQPGLSPLAGSSVYWDRIFLKKFLPQVESYLHYRIVDVSTIKELCRRWNPEIYSKAPKKEFLHRSLNDIKESVVELRWYRENFLKITI